MALQPTETSLLACCACRSWAAALAAAGPYDTLDALIEEARRLWWQQVGQPAGRARRRARWHEGLPGMALGSHFTLGMTSTVIYMFY